MIEWQEREAEPDEAEFCHVLHPDTRYREYRCVRRAGHGDDHWWSAVWQSYREPKP